MKRLFALLGLVFLPIGQTLAAPAAATGSTYEIEVLVFENRVPSLEGGELWIHDAAKAATADTAEGATLGEVPPSDSALSPAAAVLHQDTNYRILAHIRWQQTADTKSATPPVRIRSSDGQLDGTLRFYLSRFLHAELNLSWHAPPAEGTGAQGNEGQIYRLSEQRRVKTLELNYFDHPKFGALVRVAQVGKD